jgi:23S rRNA (guanosine2251-2'-O)-methyltransferase
VIEALKAGKVFDKIMIRRDAGGELLKELTDMLKGTDMFVQRVPNEKLNRITLKNHQGVIGLTSEIEYQQIEEVVQAVYERGETPFIVVLDGVTDVRNFGAIVRSAECAGVHAVVVPIKNSAPANAVAVKTSAGAMLKMPICRSRDLYRTLRYLRDSGLTVYGASEDGTDTIYDAGFNTPMAVVMGAEDVGLSNMVQTSCDQLISIPMMGTIGSLNVSVAAGVILFEAMKKRKEAEL